MEKTKLNICIASIHFFPQRTSCAVLMTDLANEFANKGHNVTVIKPSSSILKKSSFQKKDKLEIFEFRSFKIIDINFARRALNEFLLPINFYISMIFSAFRKRKFDYIIWYSPSIFFAPIIWILKKRSNSGAYLILRDIFPEWTLDLGLMKKGLIYNFFKSYSSLQYKVADTVGIQSISNFEIVKDKIAQAKIEILNNWNSDLKSNDNVFHPITQEHRIGNRNLIVYLGNMGIAQDMIFILWIAKQFQDKGFDSDFLLVGRGTEVEKLKKFVEDESLKNVFFYDEIPADEVSTLLKDCSAGLVALDPRHQTHNIPGKFISYLQAGLPIIARTSKESDLGQYITANNLGIVLSENNPKKLGSLINSIVSNKEVLDNMKKNARKLYLSEFTTSSAYSQILNAYTSKS